MRMNPDLKRIETAYDGWRRNGRSRSPGSMKRNRKTGSCWTDSRRKSAKKAGRDYDLEGKMTLNSPDQNVYQHTVHNETGVTQTSSISGSFSVTKSSGWSNSLGVNVTVKASGEVKVPVFANGKVEVSTGVTDTFTFNKSESKTEIYSFTVPVSWSSTG